MIIGYGKWITYCKIKWEWAGSERSEQAKVLPSQGWQTGRFCCVFVGKDSSTVCSFSTAKRLIRIYTTSKWFVWRKQPPCCAQFRPTGKGIVFQQDKAKPRASIVTRQKCRVLGWKFIIQPAYSPADLAPSDHPSVSVYSEIFRRWNIGPKRS